MRKMLISLFVVMILACSCQDYKELQVTSTRVEKLESLAFEKGKVTSKMNLFLMVKNPTSSTFTVKSLDAVVYTKNMEKFANIASLGQAVISPRSHEDVPILLSVELFNPLAALSKGLFSDDSVAQKDMTADVELVVNTGLFNRKVVFEGITLEELFKQISRKKENDNE